MTNVLVVDDDAGLLVLVRTILKLEGVDVLATPQAAEGLDYIDDAHPDVVILDLSMPEMDGREFYRQARLRGYEGPVIFCSAYGAAAARKELGAQAALDKPFNPEDLVGLVNGLAHPRDEGA